METLCNWDNPPSIGDLSAKIDEAVKAPQTFQTAEGEFTTIGKWTAPFVERRRLPSIGWWWPYPMPWFPPAYPPYYCPPPLVPMWPAPVNITC
jgi:hypothetical protein